jgi:gas vesicle protein
MLPSDFRSVFTQEVIVADNEGSGFLWFLAGLGIGAAVGILYAPNAGDETRQKIRDAAEQGRDVVKDRARQARDQAGSWVDRGRDYIAQQKEQFRSAVDAGKQAYHEATTEETGTAPSQ